MEATVKADAAEVKAEKDESRKAHQQEQVYGPQTPPGWNEGKKQTLGNPAGDDAKDEKLGGTNRTVALAKGKNIVNPGQKTGGLANQQSDIGRLKDIESSYEQGKASRTRSGMGNDLSTPDTKDVKGNASSGLAAQMMGEAPKSEKKTIAQKVEAKPKPQKQYTSLITDRSSWVWFNDPDPETDKDPRPDVYRSDVQPNPEAENQQDAKEVTGRSEERRVGKEC